MTTVALENKIREQELNIELANSLLKSLFINPKDEEVMEFVLTYLENQGLLINRI